MPVSNKLAYKNLSSEFDQKAKITDSLNNTEDKQTIQESVVQYKDEKYIVRENVK